MIIRFKGGPLNRRTLNGPSSQPKYLDSHGHPIPNRQGQDGALAEARRMAAAASYIYNVQRCEYTYLGRLLDDTGTEQIRLLLEHARQHPEQADQAEAEIRRIEAAAVSAA